MGTSIRLYKNNNKKSKAYGKYYGRVKATEVLNTKKLARHIAEHGSIVTEDVLLATINKMTKCIKHLLMDGKNVKLDGLGTFYLSVTSTGDSDATKYNTAANIKHVQIKFRPDASADSEVSNTRMLLDTQLVIEDSYVNPADATQNTNVSNAGGDDNGNDGSEDGQTTPERP